jgi:hypothetical protein
MEKEIYLQFVFGAIIMFAAIVIAAIGFFHALK